MCTSITKPGKALSAFDSQASHNNGATQITYDSIAQGTSNSSYTIYGGWRKDFSGTGMQSNVSGCG